jgi:hypothetical protein
MNDQVISLEDRIAQRIDSAVTKALTVSQRAGGIAYSSANEALEVAKMMAIGGIAVPQHCRGQPGVCLSIVIQSIEWGFSAYAVAKKSYVVNGNLSFESQLIQAVILKRAPIRGRFRVEYEGEGNARVCHVSAELADGTGTVDYSSPPFGQIQPKNSPLWKNDPDQQLYYFSGRALCRRHFPDVLLGIYTRDEFQDHADPDEVEILPPATLKAKLDAIAQSPSRQAEDIQTKAADAADAAEQKQEQEAPRRKPGRPKKSEQPAVPTVVAPTAEDQQEPATSSQQADAVPSATVQEADPDPATEHAGAAEAAADAAPVPTTGLTDAERTGLLAYSERLMGSMSSSGLQRRTAEFFSSEIPDEGTVMGRLVQQIFDLHTERTKQKLEPAACQNQVRALVQAA